jgi:hypothetical protein
MAKKEAAAANTKMDNRGLARIEAAKKAGRTSAQKSQEKKAVKEEKTDGKKKDE